MELNALVAAQLRETARVLASRGVPVEPDTDPGRGPYAGHFPGSLSSREDMPPLRGVTAEVEGGAYLRGGVLVLPRNGSQNHCFRLRNRHKGDPNRKNFRLRRSNLTKFWGTMAEVEGGHIFAG